MRSRQRAQGKQKRNLAAERIGESDAETGIILETEDQNAEDFSENAGGSRDRIWQMECRPEIQMELVARMLWILPEIRAQRPIP